MAMADREDRRHVHTADRLQSWWLRKDSLLVMIMLLFLLTLPPSLYVYRPRGRPFVSGSSTRDRVASNSNSLICAVP